MSSKKILNGIKTSRFALSSLKANEASGRENHRFWTQTYRLPARNDSFLESNLIAEQLLQANAEHENTFDISRVEMGILFSTQSNTVVPIHEGKLQSQHTAISPFSSLLVNNSSSLLYLCAFSPRAGQVSVSPAEEERQLDEERRDALHIALNSLSISYEDLLTAKFAGTPPARIYRSFCSPRAKAVHILEPIERAANRTAAQLQLAIRQLRADEATYLRNTDKAVVNELGSNAEQRIANPVVLVLDNIRSAFNVGSMFRTGETAGVSEIVTCGITAHPPHPKVFYLPKDYEHCFLSQCRILDTRRKKILVNAPV